MKHYCPKTFHACVCSVYHYFMDKGLVSKESVILRRWGVETNVIKVVILRSVVNKCEIKISNIIK